MTVVSPRGLEHGQYLAKLKGIAQMEEDPSLKVRLLAIVAALTEDAEDIAAACGFADEHGRKKSSLKSLVVLVKALAKSRKFEQAREVAFTMEIRNAFWVFQAWLAIFTYSGEAADKVRAENFRMLVSSGRRKKAVQQDFANALRNGVSGPGLRSFHLELSALCGKFEELGRLVGNAAPNSSVIEYDIESIVAAIFREIMKAR